LVFIFSWNISESIFGFEFKVPEKGKYKIILNSDDKKFGGFERIEGDPVYPTGKDDKIQIYLRNRTCLIFKKVK
jgi:1,4-alpha-glucan branching enzyme